MNENKITWLSPEEASKHIKVSLVTLYRYMKQGLPFYKLTGGTIRINEEELDLWIIQHRMAETIFEEGPEHYE
jgi:excisionase family DNA binding protein